MKNYHTSKEIFLVKNGVFEKNEIFDIQRKKIETLLLNYFNKKEVSRRFL